MRIFDNPILNPFYQDPRDKDPNSLVFEESSSDRDAAEPNVKQLGQLKVSDYHDKASHRDSDEDEPTATAQDGVKRAEAIAIVWGKASLIGAYAGIYLIFFFLSLQAQTAIPLQPYVYSAFKLHSLVSVSSIMSGIIGGVLRLPTAKLIDLWGRAEGFMVMVGFTTLGIILTAACDNVETYAAAQVIYYIGYDGIQYVLDVVVADTSKLKNRGLMFSFTTSPFIATTFAGPALADRFLNSSAGWRWGFGVFAILIPVVSIPFSVIFLWNQKKAEAARLVDKRASGRTWTQSILYYAVELDLIGMIIIMAGFVLFLLPFSLATYQSNKWQSADVIAMIVVGGVLLLIFPLYEKYLAPKSFIPFNLLTDRTILGACLTISGVFISFYCWDLYFSSYLQVVYGLSVSDAGYLANTYNIGSSFWGIVVGILIRQSGRFKWVGLCAVPLHILGAGLMIHFRQPNVNIGYVVMCQIFIAFAGGTLVICYQIAAMSVAKHGEIAAVLALTSLFSSVGGAVGASVSGAIWTNTFEPTLESALPMSLKNQAATIYASLDTQLSYPMGSPGRDAIIYAYGVAQKRMCIASTALSIITLIGVWMWRDVRIDNKKQVKGTTV